MDRVRLLILVSSALLATSLAPGVDSGEAPLPGTNAFAIRAAAIEAETAGAEAEERPQVTRTDPVAGDPGDRPGALAPEDADAVAAVLARLSIRHTALPARERRALARTIVEQARLRRLDPELVIAVIEVESGGYHLAVSHVGAMGLMQLLPTTAEELAGKHDIVWNGPDTLFDPTTNVKLGTAYLRELADRYGDVNVALAAYNWGPGRIDRRLRRGADLPSRYIEQVMRALDRTPRAVSRRS